MGNFLSTLFGGVLGNKGGRKFLFGSDDETKQLPTMAPEQEQILQQLLQMLSPEGQLGQGQSQGISQLQELMDPSSAAQQRFAAPHMRQFNEQTVPGLSERFAGAGAMGGGLSSSGFGQALGAAGAGLQQNMGQMKSGLQQQAIQSLLQQFKGLSQQGLGAKPFGYQHVQGSPGMLGSALTGYAQAGFPGLMQ